MGSRVGLDMYQLRLVLAVSIHRTKPNKAVNAQSRRNRFGLTLVAHPHLLVGDQLLS